MARQIADDNLLLWEAYPSGSRRGYAAHPRVIFHCVSDRALRSRYVELDGDVADAERELSVASDEQVRRWFANAREVP